MADSDNKELISLNADKATFSFTDNKFTFYTGLFYSLGLFIGSYFYKIAQSDRLNSLVALKDGTFLGLFLSAFCLYFSIFLVTVFLGFCLIGKPIIFIIPTVIGIAAGIRLGYYFINYSAKGIGYALIMIVPYTALFILVISYTIDNSSRLSSRIAALTKGEENGGFELSPYLKKYLIYSLLIIGVTLLDSGLTKLLFAVVTI